MGSLQSLSQLAQQPEKPKSRQTRPSRSLRYVVKSVFQCAFGGTESVVLGPLFGIVVAGVSNPAWIL